MREEEAWIYDDLQDVHEEIRRHDKLCRKCRTRVKELRRLRDDWERRLPVVEHEIEALTEKEIEQGWAEAYETEWDTITNSLSMSQEEMLGKKIEARECDEMVDDLRLEADDLEMDADEALMQLVSQEEKRRCMELERCTQLYKWDREQQLKKQRLRWCVKSTRTSKLRRGQADASSTSAPEAPNGEEKKMPSARRSLGLRLAETLSNRRRAMYKKKMEHEEEVARAKKQIVASRRTRHQGEGNPELRQAYDAADKELRSHAKRFTADLRIAKKDQRALCCQECGCTANSCKCAAMF
jgi:hypothetical protein